ncbi:hypothetical protein INR49_010472 [Caranx melampygus]|nr:hypothetical protein INR49_010472 [Caranx melampygus]
MKSVFVILGLLVCITAAESRGLTLVLVQTGEDLLLEVEEAHPVSPVKLTVDSVTNSSDPCDLTVTCRSLDSHQISISTTVTCNTTTCSQEGEEELKLQFLGATLHVYLLNDMIICNHSNLVSWTNDSIMVDPSLCVPPPEPTVSDRYRGRVDVSVGSFSVTLKNLQKSDRGFYTALVTVDKDQILAGCFVTVEGCRSLDNVFVLTGEDLFLEVDVLDFYFIRWAFNENATLVIFLPAREPTVSDLYRGRVEVSVKNFSVKLKNLQKSDSGVYTARVVGADKNQILAGYLVIVKDPVSPVKLTVDSVTNSSDPCDLTVTCRSLDSHQISISTTVTCNTTTCSQEGGERSKVTTFGATLSVHLLNDMIICNHSNHRMGFLVESFLGSRWVFWVQCEVLQKRRWRLEKDLKHYCLDSDPLVVLFHPGRQRCRLCNCINIYIIQTAPTYQGWDTKAGINHYTVIGPADMVAMVTDERVIQQSRLSDSLETLDLRGEFTGRVLETAADSLCQCLKSETNLPSTYKLHCLTFVDSSDSQRNFPQTHRLFLCNDQRLLVLQQFNVMNHLCFIMIHSNNSCGNMFNCTDSVCQRHLLEDRGVDQVKLNTLMMMSQNLI